MDYAWEITDEISEYWPGRRKKEKQVEDPQWSGKIEVGWVNKQKNLLVMPEDTVSRKM
jgi:hypothetical protein